MRNAATLMTMLHTPTPFTDSLSPKQGSTEQRVDRWRNSEDRTPGKAMLNYNKIMCAFEFDGNSTTALQLSGTLAKESTATLYVLHVARVPTQDMDVPLPFDSHPRWETEARSRLAQIVKEILKPEVQYVIEVRTGVPDLDIVQAARDLGVDLIVMVTHGRTGLKHFVLGSVTEHIIREAPCPVLVLHHTAPTAELA